MTVKLRSPDAYFIQVDVQFATEYGINEAILAGKLLRLMGKLAGATDDAGAKWIRLTLEEWGAEVPFMLGPKGSDMTIRRTIESLKNKGIILTRTFKGRSIWYRLNPDFIDDNAIVQNEQLPAEKEAIVQNEQIVIVQNEQFNCAKRTDTIVQNEQLPRVLPRVLPIGEGESPPAFSSSFEDLAKKALIIYSDTAGIKLDKTQASAITNLIKAEPEFNFTRWVAACTSVKLGGVKPENVQCRIDTYRAGGNYQAMISAKRNGNGAADTPAPKVQLRGIDPAVYKAQLEADRAAAAETKELINKTFEAGVTAAGLDIERAVRKSKRNAKKAEA